MLSALAVPLAPLLALARPLALPLALLCASPSAPLVALAGPLGLLAHLPAALVPPPGGQEGAAESPPIELNSELSALDGDRRWWDLDSVRIEGRAFDDRAATWDRLPQDARALVRPPVWDLSRDSAGIAARFSTDSTAIDLRWTLRSDKLGMPHMPATGVSGVDLYVRQGERWRWVRNGRPTGKQNQAWMVRGLQPQLREYLVYLPLYNGVEAVSLGLDPDARLCVTAPRPRPVVFYGTSITQGACASRPGMAHVAILGRRLDRPVVNLGFSGNGKLEVPFVTLMAQVDAGAYVLDCLPNMDAAAVHERAFVFVLGLHNLRPEVPILLVEDRSYADAPFDKGHRERNAGNRAALREVHARLLENGVQGVYYLDGDSLLGADGDDTVDGSHPSDLGFMRHADAFEPVLRRMLMLRGR